MVDDDEDAPPQDDPPPPPPVRFSDRLQEADTSPKPRADEARDR